MVTPELLNYIRQQLALGKPEADIKQALLAQGWQEADVNEGVTQSHQAPAVPTPASAGTGVLAGATTIFSEAWQIYRSKFWTFIAIQILPTAIIFALGFFGAGSLALMTALAGNKTPSIGVYIIFGILALLVFLGVIYISLWAQTALVYLIKDRSENIGFSEAFKRASHSIGSYFAASFLAGAITALGFILFIIPGIIFGLWYSLSTYIVVGENETAGRALKKSREYVRGYWWKIFWRFLFIGIIYLVVYFGLAIVINLVVRASGNSELTQTIAGVVMQVISLTLTPLVIVYGYKVFESVKAAKGQVNVDGKSNTGIIITAIAGVLVIVIGLMASVALLALNSARAKSRDAKRLADTRQMMAALEIYYNDFGQYPQTASQLTPTYIGQLPTAPQPKDGPCVDSENTYQYKLQSPSEYTLTFCLGQNTGGYYAGPHTATPKGIK